MPASMCSRLACARVAARSIDARLLHRAREVSRMSPDEREVLALVRIWARESDSSYPVMGAFYGYDDLGLPS